MARSGPTDSVTYDIVIDYALEDQELVVELCDRLKKEQGHLKVFDTQIDITLGQNEIEALDGAVRKARFWAIFFSKNYLEENHKKLLRHGNLYGVQSVKIIPILLPGFDPHDLPTELQALKLGVYGTDRFYTQFVKSVTSTDADTGGFSSLDEINLKQLQELCRKSINARFKEHSPFVWAPNRKIETRRFFMPLHLTDDTRKRLFIENLFDPTINVANPLRILVEGLAGSGKSMLTKILTLNWCDQDEYISKFKLVFLIQSIDYGQGLKELVFSGKNVLHPKDFGSKSIDTFWKTVKKHETQILWIIEGDEYLLSKLDLDDDVNVNVNDVDDTQSDIVRLIRGDDFEKSTVLVASRPLSTVSLVYFDLKIYNNGFYQKKPQKFIKEFSEKYRQLFSPTIPEYYFESIVTSVRQKDSVISELIQNPLNCIMLLGSRENVYHKKVSPVKKRRQSSQIPCPIPDTMVHSGPHSVVSLFNDMVNWVLKSYYQKCKSNVQDLDGLTKKLEKQMAHLAQENLKQEESITHQYIKENYSLHKDMCEFGLLSMCNEGTPLEPFLCYHFTHDSVEEFLAAKHVVEHIENKPGERMTYYTQLRDQTGSVFEMYMFWVFTAGLLAKKGELDSLNFLFKLLLTWGQISEEAKGLSLDELRLVLDCLFECTQYTEDIRKEVIDHFPKVLKRNEDPAAMKLTCLLAFADLLPHLSLDSFHLDMSLIKDQRCLHKLAKGVRRCSEVRIYWQGIQEFSQFLSALFTASDKCDIQKFGSYCVGDEHVKVLDIPKAFTDGIKNMRDVKWIKWKGCENSSMLKDIVSNIPLTVPIVTFSTCLWDDVTKSALQTYLSYSKGLAELHLQKSKHDGKCDLNHLAFIDNQMSTLSLDKETSENQNKKITIFVDKEKRVYCQSSPV